MGNQVQDLILASWVHIQGSGLDSIGTEISPAIFLVLLLSLQKFMSATLSATKRLLYGLESSLKRRGSATTGSLPPS